MTRRGIEPRAIPRAPTTGGIAAPRVRTRAQAKAEARRIHAVIKEHAANYTTSVPTERTTRNTNRATHTKHCPGHASRFVREGGAGFGGGIDAERAALPSPTPIGTTPNPQAGRGNPAPR